MEVLMTEIRGELVVPGKEESKISGTTLPSLPLPLHAVHDRQAGVSDAMQRASDKRADERPDLLKRVDSRTFGADEAIRCGRCGRGGHGEAAAGVLDTGHTAHRT